MGSLKGKSKTPSGEHEFQIEVADEHLAQILSSILGSEQQQSKEPSRGPRQARLIIREDRPHPRTPRSSFTQAEIEVLRLKIPSREEIAEYIGKQENLRHSLEDVATHFLGKVPKALSSNHDEKRLFFILQDRTADARKKVARSREGGKFRLEALKFGKSRVYSWLRDGRP